MAIHAPQGVRLLAVLGPSGSGKSSVVLAGLIPRVNAGAIDGSEQWRTAVVRPGDDPLANLAVEVSAPFLPKGAVPDVGQRKLIEDLQGDERGLDLFARLALAMRRASAAARGDRPVRGGVHLPAAGRASEGPVREGGPLSSPTCCTPRPRRGAGGGRPDDAVGLLGRLHGLSTPGRGAERSPGVDRSDDTKELHRAIEQPAYLVGCELGEGLSDLLIDDVKGQAGALPLLQFTLKELWTMRGCRR